VSRARPPRSSRTPAVAQEKPRYGGELVFVVPAEPPSFALGKDWFDVKEGEASIVKPEGNAKYTLLTPFHAGSDRSAPRKSGPARSFLHRKVIRMANGQSRTLRTDAGAPKRVCTRKAPHPQGGVITNQVVSPDADLMLWTIVLASFSSTFPEVQGMPLIVFDDELFCSPGGLVHVLHKANPISLQRVCRSSGIVCFKIEVKVFALIYEFDRGILLVHEF
jgi:hypothetical protein